jgi:hypothetical protein
VPVVAGALLVVGLVTHSLFRRRLDGTKTSLLLAFVASSAIVSLALGRLTLKSGVWLFLLPLAIIWSSAGLAFLWEQVRTRSGRAKDAIFVALVLAVSAWLGWRVLVSGSILRSRETGTLPSAEQVASYLGDEARSGDAIAALYPSDALIRYYQRRHGAPDLPFYRPGDALPASRLLAVVNTTIEQPLEVVIDRLGLAPRLDLASARPLRVFETAVVVEIPVAYGHGTAEGQEGK